MKQLDPRPFIAWLEVQCAIRGWTFHQLSRQAGISHSVISKARIGIMPKWESCVAIATALNMPPEAVFRKAGLLDTAPSDTADMEEWSHLMAQLSSRDREELVRLARIKLEIQQREIVEQARIPEVNGVEPLH